MLVLLHEWISWLIKCLNIIIVYVCAAAHQTHALHRDLNRLAENIIYTERTTMSTCVMHVCIIAVVGYRFSWCPFSVVFQSKNKRTTIDKEFISIAHVKEWIHPLSPVTHIEFIDFNSLICCLLSSRIFSLFRLFYHSSNSFSCYFHFFSPFLDNVNAVPAVSVAAKKLSILLQQNGNMAYQPDPFTANILNKWLETHLPVSFTHSIYFEFFVLFIFRFTSRLDCLFLVQTRLKLNKEIQKTSQALAT